MLKLTNNILTAVAATAEAFVMGAKGGLDPEVMLAAINAGSGRNSATDTRTFTNASIRILRRGAMHRVPNISATRPLTSGATPGYHSMPIAAANTSVLVGVGGITKIGGEHDRP